MNGRIKIYLHLLITLFIMAFIFQRSALSADMSALESGRLAELIARFLPLGHEPAEFLVRKTAHFTEYLMLGASLAVNVNDCREWKWSGMLPAVSFAAPWIIGTLYAVTDEVHQYFVPGRSCELRDVVIDACGTAAGVLIMKMIGGRLSCKSDK